MLQAVIQIIVLGSLIRFGLRRYEKGRTFAQNRVWVAATAVVGLYAIPAVSDYLYHWRMSLYPRLPPFLFSLWGGVIWSLVGFVVLFLIQWVFYRVYLKDDSGVPLSTRGNVMVAAIPTIGLLILKFGAALLIALVFFLISFAQ